MSQVSQGKGSSVGVWMVAGLVLLVLVVVIAISVDDSNRRSACYQKAGNQALEQAEDGREVQPANC